MEIDLADQQASESESEIENTAPTHRANSPRQFSIEFSNGSRAIACDSEIGIPKSPRRIQLNSPRELAVVQPPPRILRGNWRLFRPYIQVVWYLQLALTVINALSGWSVSALVAQGLNGAFNWS